jgi:DNA mismatch repair protein MutH
MNDDIDEAMAARAAALLQAARRLAGIDVASLGGHGKGGVGQRVEQALGLAPRFDDVDDPESGVELKTLPVRLRDGRATVTEVTFVTTATTDSLIAETWATSRVRKKLRQVLFVPVVDVGDDGGGAGGDGARLGAAFLWRPDAAEEARLRADWEDLSDLVARGLGFAVTSRRGVWLHLRPKAKNAAQTRRASIVDDDDVVLRPQGFYLRRTLTQRLLEGAVVVGGGAARLGV